MKRKGNGYDPRHIVSQVMEQDCGGCSPDTFVACANKSMNIIKFNALAEAEKIKRFKADPAANLEHQHHPAIIAFSNWVFQTDRDRRRGKMGCAKKCANLGSQQASVPALATA